MIVCFIPRISRVQLSLLEFFSSVAVGNLRKAKAVAALRLAAKLESFGNFRFASRANFISTPSFSLLLLHLLLSLLSRPFSKMAGGGGKYRHLGRKSSHRQALLRNLVTSLFENESITTTWHKAKEAQRLADKLITLGKKNSEASRRRALEIFYVSEPTSVCHFEYIHWISHCKGSSP